MSKKHRNKWWHLSTLTHRISLRIRSRKSHCTTVWDRSARNNVSTKRRTKPRSLILDLHSQRAPLSGGGSKKICFEVSVPWHRGNSSILQSDLSVRCIPSAMYCKHFSSITNGKLSHTKNGMMQVDCVAIKRPLHK